MTILAQALNLPLGRVIHATNRTFFPELDLESLFPGQAIPIDTRENDVAMIQAYAENPGTPGQYVFAARKRLADHPGRSEWSRREGFSANYLYERENNRVRILPANLGEWSELFRRLDIPSDVLRILAKVHGKVLMSSPEHIFAEGSQGRSLQSLVEQTGISSPTLSDAARLSRTTKPATIREMKAAMPDLDAAALYVRAHPAIVKFFPEAGNENGPQPLELSEEQLAQAQRFHLGSALYRFRYDPPQDLLTETSSVHVDMAALADRLGVTKQAVSAYESIFVRIEDAGVLERAADLLGLDRRMLYLHYNPEILDIFPIDFEGNPALVESGSAGFLKEANRFYDRSNLRRRLFAEVVRIRGPQRMESAMKPRDLLALTLGIDRASAAKYLGEGRVLEVEDIRRLSSLVPALDYRQWFEHFNRSELAFFLGTHPDGSVDFRPPADLPPRVVTPVDQLAVFLDRIEELGLSSRYGSRSGLESTILSGGRLRTSTLLQLSFSPGLDRRWLYFHFRRPELEPILQPLPNF
jgi:transcriptional regulator with XRE-family HTH domain